MLARVNAPVPLSSVSKALPQVGDSPREQRRPSPQISVASTSVGSFVTAGSASPSTSSRWHDVQVTPSTTASSPPVSPPCAAQKKPVLQLIGEPKLAISPRNVELGTSPRHHHGPQSTSPRGSSPRPKWAPLPNCWADDESLRSGPTPVTSPKAGDRPQHGVEHITPPPTPPSPPSLPVHPKLGGALATGPILSRLFSPAAPTTGATEPVAAEQGMSPFALPQTSPVIPAAVPLTMSPPAGLPPVAHPLSPLILPSPAPITNVHISPPSMPAPAVVQPCVSRAKETLVCMQTARFSGCKGCGRTEALWGSKWGKFCAAEALVRDSWSRILGRQRHYHPSKFPACPKLDKEAAAAVELAMMGSAMPPPPGSVTVAVSQLNAAAAALMDDIEGAMLIGAGSPLITSLCNVLSLRPSTEGSVISAAGTWFKKALDENQTASPAMPTQSAVSQMACAPVASPSMTWTDLSMTPQVTPANEPLTLAMEQRLVPNTPTLQLPYNASFSSMPALESPCISVGAPPAPSTAQMHGFLVADSSQQFPQQYHTHYAPCSQITMP